MKTDRGVSQILFGFLPDQTADLENGVWKVARWVDPLPLLLDQDALRSALKRAAWPWEQAGCDDGLGERLNRQSAVGAFALNPAAGVEVQPFPRLWKCSACGRISTDKAATCPCGSKRKGQLQFVTYHGCGAFGEPIVPKCPVHQASAMHQPGTTRISEIVFTCPECGRPLGKGFRTPKCACGDGNMNLAVHRSAQVFTPRFTALINSPDTGMTESLKRAGRARLLEWMLDGMESDDPTSAPPTEASIFEMLLNQGFSEADARENAAAMAKKMGLESGAGSGAAVEGAAKQAAAEESAGLATAVMSGRLTLASMHEGSVPPLQTLYTTQYEEWLKKARLETVDLLTEFPVATVAFGYTRGGVRPGESRLVTFKDQSHQPIVYGALNHTEALLFRLDAVAVHGWLVEQGLLSPARVSTRRDALLAILEHVSLPMPGEENPQPLGKAVMTLVHSYAHRMIRRMAPFAGTERESMSEYLFPHSLAFIVYVQARGEFVLGGLQAVYESALHDVLQDFIQGERRCPLDPGCKSSGSACMACLHLGEPSCRLFNTMLSREVLFGPAGFLS